MESFLTNLVPPRSYGVCLGFVEWFQFRLLAIIKLPFGTYTDLMIFTAKTLEHQLQAGRKKDGS